MIVIPAIDLMGGEVVRLEKGDFATKKVYAARPADAARDLVRKGAKLLHVVDLDGAKAGWPVNLDAVKAICEVPGVEVELGGGLRTLPDLEKVLALGVATLEDIVACREAGLHGVIVGKALYEGRIDLVAALRAAAGEGS
jgi:phosphoribosylformimino-5-aminoimidazole carboxamide ribonucleotide (ProFAR) isomerase